MRLRDETYIFLIILHPARKGNIINSFSYIKNICMNCKYLPNESHLQKKKIHNVDNCIELSYFQFNQQKELNAYKWSVLKLTLFKPRDSKGMTIISRKCWTCTNELYCKNDLAELMNYAPAKRFGREISSIRARRNERFKHLHLVHGFVNGQVIVMTMYYILLTCLHLLA